MYGVTILGNNSAIPAYDRHPTAQALLWDDQVFLIDCGEGTQMQLARYKIRRGKINHIFISHLHGDHYFGLIGLITSMGLMNREVPLHIYGPPSLIEIIQLQLKVADTHLSYEIVFHPLEKEGMLLEDQKIVVKCFEVKHRISCWGFTFFEKKPPRSLLKDAVISAGIPQIFYARLKWGEDYTTKDGALIKNELVTAAAAAPVSYAYCADTIFDPSICQHFQGVSLLYHEATFLHDLSERAKARFHSTAYQAGLIAVAAKAQQLIIGHFSSKYEFLEPFLTEVQEVFPNALLALEGATYIIHRSMPHNSQS